MQCRVDCREAFAGIGTRKIAEHFRERPLRFAAALLKALENVAPLVELARDRAGLRLDAGHFVRGRRHRRLRVHHGALGVLTLLSRSTSPSASMSPALKLATAWSAAAMSPAANRKARSADSTSARAASTRRC